MWTVVELDREERAEVTVEVVVGDAGGRVASYPVTVVVEDVNDNPMRPGAKVVRVWKVQVSGEGEGREWEKRWMVLEWWGVVEEFLGGRVTGKMEFVCLCLFLFCFLFVSFVLFSFRIFSLFSFVFLL